MAKLLLLFCGLLAVDMSAGVKGTVDYEGTSVAHCADDKQATAVGCTWGTLQLCMVAGWLAD